MRAVEVLWKRAGTQGNNEGEQSSLSVTHPSSDLLEQRQALSGPFPVLYHYTEESIQDPQE